MVFGVLMIEFPTAAVINSVPYWKWSTTFLTNLRLIYNSRLMSTLIGVLFMYYTVYNCTMYNCTANKE